MQHIPVNPNPPDDFEHDPNATYIAKIGGKCHLCALEKKGKLWLWHSLTYGYFYLPVNVEWVYQFIMETKKDGHT